MKRKRVLIIGGGFGGLATAKALKNANVDVVLIDKTNHHLFQPLLYQVASASLSPANIASPIRAILKSQKNCRVVMAEVTRIDRKRQIVSTNQNEKFNYDYLVVATGSRHHYFGKTIWEKHAPGLKTLDDALQIRERILRSFEKAEVLNKNDRNEHLTFVVIGAGPTGVEMAGAISEIAFKTMVKDFRSFDSRDAKIYLIEGGPRVLAGFDEMISVKAEKILKKLNVQVLTNSIVTDISPAQVIFKKSGKIKKIATQNIIWAAGNQASPLLNQLNAKQDNLKRVVVDVDCSLVADENIYIIGDAASFQTKTGESLPALSPVAIQQGKYIASIIKKGIGKQDRIPFQYLDKGSMATIGKAKAVAQIHTFKFAGLFAWLLWVFVHILYLIGFRNRLSVMLEWFWHYITFQRGARLIVHSENDVKKK